MDQNAQNPPTPLADLARALLLALLRCAQSMRLYDKDHAATRRAVDDVMATLDVMRAHQELTIRCVDSAFNAASATSAEQAINESKLADLAARLGAANITAIRVKTSLTPGEIPVLAEVLDRLSTGKLSIADARTRLADASGAKVQIVAVRDGDVALREWDGTVDQADDWSRVLERLASGVADTAEMARRVEAGIGAAWSSGSSARSPLVSAAEALRAVPEDQRAVVMTQFGALVGELDPAVRKKMLWMAGKDATHTRAVADLAEVLPASDVIEAISSGGLPQGGTARHSLRVLSKLVQTEGAATQTGARLHNVLSEWSNQAESVSGTDEQLRAAVTVLLKASEGSPFNPDDYEVTLNQIASTGSGEESTLRAIVWDDLGEHTLSIARFLATTEMDVESIGALAVRVAPRADRLLAEGRFDLLLEAMAMPRSGETTDEFTRSRETLRAAVASRVDSLMQLVSHEGLTREPALELLSRIEPRIVLAHAVASDAKIQVVIISALRDAGTDWMRLGEAVAKESPTVALLASRSGAFHDDEVLSLVSGVVPHIPANVRRDLLLELDIAHDHWPLALIGWGIRTDDEVLQSRMIDRIRETHSDRAVPILEQYLREDFGVEVSGTNFELAAKTLAEYGEAGAVALESIADQVRSRFGLWFYTRVLRLRKLARHARAAGRKAA
ncbi:MAG: hypothetical protein AB7Q00_12170 [Phycisphaerales bacterium]